MAFDEILAISVFTLIGLAIVCLVGHHTQTLAPALAGFSARWVGAFVVFSLVGLGSPDATYYDATAFEFAAGNSSAAVTVGKEGWPTLLAAVYVALGHIPQLGLVINALFGALTVSVIGHAGKLLGTNGRIGAWIFALFPTGILWSTLLLRESITWFGVALSGVAFLGLAKSRRYVPYFIMLAAGLLALLAFRGTAAITVGVAGVIALAYVKRRLFETALVGLLAAPLLVVSPLGQRIQEVLEDFSADRINASRESLSSAAATGWPYIEVTDSFSAAQAWGVAAPRVAVGPFPWEWSTSGLILSLDALTWCVLLVLSIRGIILFPARRVLATLALPAIALLLALVVTSGNYGTMQRLRAQPAVSLIPIAALALPLRKSVSHRDGPTSPSVVGQAASIAVQPIRTLAED